MPPRPRPRTPSGVVQVEALAVREHPVSNLKDLGVGFALLDRDRDGVERPGRLVGDALSLEQRAHRAQAVAFARGVLEPLLGRRPAHLAFELALDLAVAAR